MNRYLAIDQGTHASRAVLFDERGKQVAHATCPLVVECDRPGHAEYDPLRLIASVGSALQQVVEAAAGEGGDRVIACGIAVQRSTVIAWRDDGTPLSPVVSWRDVRAADEIRRLAEHGERVRRISDLPLSAYYGAGKLAWLLQHEPAVQRCAVEKLRLSPLASYILFHLLDGHPYIVDHTIAQRTQLLDSSTLDWSQELADLFDIPLHTLPRCVPMIGRHGNLTGSRIPVTTVCGDQNAAFFGTGPCREDTAVVNIGSGAFILHSPPGKPDGGNGQLCGIAYSDAKRVSYMSEATVNGAGNALDWLQRQYSVDDLEARLPEWLQAVSTPPVFINTVGGLGTPWMRDDIEPFFVDDDASDVPARAVAVVESIVFLLACNIEIMPARLTRLQTGGGLSHLDALCQKLSNLTSLQVERGEYADTTARGAAWLAAGGPAHWFERDACTVFVPQPDPGLRERYRVFTGRLARALDSQ